MAKKKDSKKDLEVQEGEKKDKKNKRSKRMLIIITMIVVLVGAGGGLGLFFFFKVSSEDLAAKDAAAKKAAPQLAPAHSRIYMLEPLEVNLKQGGEANYLDVKIALELTDEQAKELISIKQPQIKELILLFLSGRNTSQLEAATNKIELKRALISRINRTIGEIKVINLYFTQFLIRSWSHG